ncbi:MAG: SusC/RagA family TonB-linked outer membrane protein [Parafilimonas sp.]
MKFTIVLLIVGFVQVGATGFSQTVTLKFNKAPLQDVFKELEKQSGYSFVYGKEQLSTCNKVSVDVKNIPVENALALIFKNQPLDYVISGKYISIRQKSITQDVQQQPPPPFEVSGKIVNDLGSPLEGITVSIKGTNTATQTDANGFFKLNAPNSDVTLIISAVNYEKQEMQLNGRSVINNIVLNASVNSLNEIVITGYSAQRKKDITGAVSVVNTSDLKTVPASDATEQLQGRASGVTVLLNGTPGVPAQVKIRGLGSFSNNSPLYVVDGVQTFDISSIAPEDIESMQVLKDAASASIYGVRSSNGVIVITTKKGKAGSVVSYNMSYGSQMPSKKFYNNTVLSPEEQAQLVFLVNKNQGIPNTGSIYGDGTEPVLPDYLFAGLSGTNPPSGPINEGNPIADPSKYSLDPSRIGDPGYVPYIIVKANKQGTDWWDLAIRNAPIQNHNLTFSNATEKSRFLLSLNYFDQQAITILQFYKRYNVRMNSEFTLMKGVRIGENFSIGASTANVQGNSSGGNTSNNQESSDFNAVFNAQIVPVYTINGRDFAGSAGGFGGPNPIANLTRKKDNRDNFIDILGNVYAEVDIIPHLTFRSSFGGYINTENSITYPFIEYENSLNRSIRTLSEGWIRGSRWIFTNQLSYKNTFGKHSISGLVGYESQKDEGRQVITSATGFYTFAYLNYLTLQNGGQPNLTGSAKFIPVTTASAFGQINYEYDNKYLLSVLVRRDGSSKFSGDNLYGTFPAASLGWRISNENFMHNIKWINDLKIRGSYGLSGNEQAVGANNIYTTYVSSPANSYYDLLERRTILHKVSITILLVMFRANGKKIIQVILV